MVDSEGTTLICAPLSHEDDSVDKTWTSRRVLIAADTFPPDVNGAARFTRDHAVRLSRRGHQVHVVAPATKFSTSSGIEEYDGEKIYVHRFRSVPWPLHDWLRFAPPWEVSGQMKRLLSAVRPDVIHIQSFMVIGRGAALEGHARGVPVIATNHVMPENLIEYSGFPRTIHPAIIRFGWRLAASTYERVQVITSPTPIAAEYLESRAGISPVEPVSCGIDVGRFTAKTRKPTDAHVMYLGRLDREKNIATLIRAFALLAEKMDAHLDIVGSGSEKDVLETLADECGIVNRVTFHGRVSDKELELLHHRAAVFVMPSPAELQSLASLEAMASGTPIVVADEMALPHLLTDGVEGYLSPTYDVNCFADRISRLLVLDNETYMRFSGAARAKALTHDSAQIIRRYEGLYERAIAAMNAKQNV